MFFVSPEIRLKVQDELTPKAESFVRQERLFYPADQDSVRVLDADGIHQVSIVEAAGLDFQLYTPIRADASYCVFSWIDINSMMIAKCDAILPAVYVRVFGPATEQDCARYIAAHGTSDTQTRSGADTFLPPTDPTPKPEPTPKPAPRLDPYPEPFKTIVPVGMQAVLHVLTVPAGFRVVVGMYRGRDEVSRVRLLWRSGNHPNWQDAGALEPNGERRWEFPYIAGFQAKGHAWEATVAANIRINDVEFSAPRIDISRRDPNLRFLIYGGANDPHPNTEVMLEIVR